MANPRWVLRAKQYWWQMLMHLGMIFHRIPHPRPISHSFARTVPSTISGNRGEIKLLFYTPVDYDKSKSYPVIINFHGGGFTLGRGTDDARWATVCTRDLELVFVSVEYRLAPTYPFPTAVEDGADAVLYLSDHAQEFGLDRKRFAISGFSSGGNLAFTVPLCLQRQLNRRKASIAETEMGKDMETPRIESTPEPSTQPPLLFSSEFKPSQTRHDFHLRAIVAWYPATDYTRSRDQRKATSRRVDKTLPKHFGNLFDEAYIYPTTGDRADPFLSPHKASTEELKAALPDDIILFTCEWDMLLEEGERFKERLVQDAGKRVRYHMVESQPHAWDKKPKILRPPRMAKKYYHEACTELKKIFYDSGVDSGLKLEYRNDGGEMVR